MRLDAFVLETLTSRRVDELNFQFGSTRVYPSGYRSDIAGCIRNGSIRLSSAPSSISTTPHLISGQGSFIVDAPPGHVHILYINPDLTEEISGELHVKQGLSTQERASLRGTIIHEATHALQDWQRASLDPRLAEGAAYLAGAITSRLWGFQLISPIVNPRVSGTAYSLTLADWFLSSPRHIRYLIPMDDVLRMKSLVRTGSSERYVFNGI